MKKYCVARMQGKILSFLLDEQGHALEIHCDAEDDAESRKIPKLGDIYIGRVQSVVKNIQAAFVEISPGTICYLPLEDVEKTDGGKGLEKKDKGYFPVLYTKKGSSPQIQQGDELAVQIFREAVKTKVPAVTTRMSFSGKYGILDLGHPGIGVSRKLPEFERERLREIGKLFLEKYAEKKDSDSRIPGKKDLAHWNKEIGEPGEIGIVLRTNAAKAKEEEIFEELRQLVRQMEHISETARYRTCYSCLFQSPVSWMKRLLSLHMDEIEAIRIEEDDLYQQAEEFIRENNPELQKRLIRYQDDLLSMEKMFSLERELKNALSQQVWLDCGGYLVIQPTEALTVIDVNSGKCDFGKKKEEAIRKVNLEAARETARQLRLRNLSGIILVDFINMQQEASKRQVMETLRHLLTLDPVQAHVVDITKLGLVEITRKKTEKPLYESLR